MGRRHSLPAVGPEPQPHHPGVLDGWCRLDPVALGVVANSVGQLGHRSSRSRPGRSGAGRRRPAGRSARNAAHPAGVQRADLLAEAAGRAGAPPRRGRPSGRRSGGAGTSRRAAFSSNAMAESECEGALALPLLGGGSGVGPAGQGALACVGQAGQRGDDRTRVPVGPDDPGVGIGGQHGVEVPQVVGRLEDPALGRLAGLQGLEGETVLGIGRESCRPARASGRRSGRGPGSRAPWTARRT